MFLAETEGQTQEAQPAEGEVEPEDPAPGRVLREDAADQGTAHGAHRPGERLPPEPLPALAEGHQVRDEDLGEGNDAAAADALDSSPDQQGFHGLGGGADEGADGE